METTMFRAFANNIALLLILAILYNASYFLPSRFRRMKPVFDGVMIALICITLMMMPFPLKPGVYFDTRSILISVTGLMFGWVPTVITVAAAVLFRIGSGGSGMLAGLAVILSSALIGLGWRRFAFKNPIGKRWLHVLFMSITVHLAMVACMLLLPYPDNLITIRAIALPVMVLYPVASILLSMMLMRQHEYIQIQAELQRSEERFRILFDQAPLGYQSLDFEGKILQVNQQWLNILGFRSDEVIGKWFGDFLSPQEQEIFRARFQVFKQEGHIHCETTMLRKDGTPVAMSVEGKIHFGATGDTGHTHCILQDITKQKSAENDLRVSEEKYRWLYETMAQGIVHQSATGEILSANPAAMRILGFDLDQMKGKSSMDPIWAGVREDGSPVPGTDHPAMIALRTGKPYGPMVMGVYNPQTNSHVWLSIIAIPIFHPGDTAPYQVYTTFQDMTAEHKANREYQQMFEEMVDGFALHDIILDEQGKPIDYRFLAVNPAFESITGEKASEIIGKTVMQVLPDTEPYWIETYGKVALSGEPVTLVSYAQSSGKYYEVSAYQPLPGQFACTFSDVTQRVLAERSTRKDLFRFRSLLNNSPSPIVIVDEKGTVVEVSSVAKELFGLSEGNRLDVSVPEWGPRVIADRIAQFVSGQSKRDTYIESLDVFEHEGTTRFFESRLFPIHAPDMTQRLYAYLAIDVTQRTMAEQALKASERRYSSYIEASPYAVFVIDREGYFIEANPAATALTGYNREELVGSAVLDLMTEGSRAATMAIWERLKTTDTAGDELQFVTKDGVTRWCSLDAVKLFGNQYLVFSVDTTAKRQAEEELRYIGYHDILTGLYNRRFYEEQLARLDTPDGLPLSIMMADINGVKLVNDAFGHAEGDKLIKDCATIMSNCCRPTDTIARIGGDEFGILMPATDAATAMAMLKRIQAALAAADKHSRDGRIQHSVALGYSTKKSADEDIAKMAIVAEEYMYQRKLLEYNSSHSAIIASIKATMIEKSQETERHAERLVVLSRAVAAKLNLPQSSQDKLELLATLHDIGKIGINDQILRKNGKLTEEEWDEMKKHPEIGYRIAMASPELMPIADGILGHHERWDGGGYPRGLRGEDIPLLSRVLALVDSYDAMTQDRPYRQAMSHEEAVLEIQSKSGTQYDPRITRLFLEVLRDESGQVVPAL